MAGPFLLFNGVDAAGNDGLWVSNGTPAGTLELTGISGANASGVNPSQFVDYNGEVLFAGVDAAGNNGLWVTNGTTAGTSELTGISGANASGVAPIEFTVVNLPNGTSEALFNGIDAAGNFGLWVTNGTAAGTSELTGISGAYPRGVNPNHLTAFNGEALFAGLDTAGNYGLWVTNGTAAGTFELTGISGANATDFAPYDLTVLTDKDEVLFNGYDSNNTLGLWVTNGTAAGTYELTGISGASPTGLNPTDLTVFDGEVLFNGIDAAGNDGLWVTDGTAAGTQELTAISGANTGAGGLRAAASPLEGA